MHFCPSSNNNCNRPHQLWGRAPQDWCEVICSASWRWIRRDHLQGGGVWLACRQVSYWGCFGLFSGPVGHTGWRKQFESYENSISNNALRDIYFTISPCLLFIVLLSIFIPSCFLSLFNFFFLLYNKKFRWHYKEKFKKLPILAQGSSWHTEQHNSFLFVGHALRFCPRLGVFWLLQLFQKSVPTLSKLNNADVLCWQMHEQALCLLAHASDHSSLIRILLFKRPPQQRFFGISTHRTQFLRWDSNLLSCFNSFHIL